MAPQAIDQQKIAEVVQQFADGARNAIAAGALSFALASFAYEARQMQWLICRGTSTCSERQFSTCQSAACGHVSGSISAANVTSLNSSLLSSVFLAGFDGVEIHGANG